MKKLILICSAIFLINCKKGDINGKAKIAAFVYHHGIPINLPKFYIKFDAKELPSDPINNYDLKIEGKHENHAHIEELRYGDYYIYATGFDSTIMLPVSGGIPVKIAWQDRKNEIEVNIQVVE